MPVTQNTRRKPAPLSFWLHSLFGLKLSVFLAFVCLTGTISTVSHEIEWLYKPELRATTVLRDTDWGAMWDAAQNAHPDAALSGIGSFDRNDEDYFVKSVSAVDAKGVDFTIYVDPGKNEVTGHEYGRSFQDFMRALHYTLFAPTAIPIYAVTALGFFLILALVTGLISYKKFWRGFFKPPRSNHGARTWFGDLHRLIGLWSLWFVALIGLTSVWYFVENAGIDLQTPEPSIEKLKDMPPVKGVLINRWVAIAKAEMPGLALTAVALPYEAGEPVIVQGQWQAWLVRERTNAVFIDPIQSRVIGTRIAHRIGIGERIVHTADPLHFGTFGGLITKLIWVVFGLCLTVMAGSGAYIFAKRTRIAITSSVGLGALDYLGVWKWPSLAAITLVPTVSFIFW